jgi:hypothetical protein
MLSEKNSVIDFLYFLSIFGCGYFLKHLTCVQIYTPALLTASFTLATTGVQWGAQGMLKENTELDSCAQDVEKSNYIQMIKLAVQVAKLCTQHRKSSNSNMGKISKSALLNVISFVIEMTLIK